MTNIVLITMDDMREDEMRYMPNVRKLLLAEGTEFTNCSAEQPLCSPSRTGLLTGQLATGWNGTAHTAAGTKFHGVTTNFHVPSALEYDNSVWKAMSNAGFRNGMFGKFIKESEATTAKAGFKPTENNGVWRGLVTTTSAYQLYDAYLYGIHNGVSETQYSGPGEYQDFRLCREAINFLADTAPTQKWGMWFCPTQPHWPWQEPPNAEVADKYKYHAFPFVFEPDVSDKPSWIQNLPALDDAVLAETQMEETVRLRELWTCDLAIAALIQFIEGTGQMDNTVIIFTSDNGNMCGEHRITGGSGNRTGVKNTPYPESMRVPCVIRGPGFPHQKVSVPVTNLDITATMHDVANSTPLLPNQYGVSLAIIAANPVAHVQRQVVCHRDAAGSPAAPAGMPSCDMLISGPVTPTATYPNTYQLNRFDTDVVADKWELYDLVTDPNCHVNRAYAGGTWLTLRNTLEGVMNTHLAP